MHGALSVAMRLLPLPAMILVGCPVNVRTLAGVPADIVGNFAVPTDFNLTVTSDGPDEVWAVANQVADRMAASGSPVCVCVE